MIPELIQSRERPAQETHLPHYYESRKSRSAKTDLDNSEFLIKYLMNLLDNSIVLHKTSYFHLNNAIFFVKIAKFGRRVWSLKIELGKNCQKSPASSPDF